MRDRDHDDVMAEFFAEDPIFAVDYLNELIQNGEPDDLLIALRQMAKAKGGVRVIARHAQLNANQLYRTLSRDGNPELRSLVSILNALGFCLAVQPTKQRVAG